MEQVLFFLALLSLGYFIGRGREMKHYKSIRVREAASRRMAVMSAKTLPSDAQVAHAELVTGHVVISVDYFKRVIAGLRNIFGGRVTSYESLLDRARREAILRMKKNALDVGASQVINFRMETSSVGGMRKDGQTVGAIEAHAYGTAIKFH